MGPVGQRTPHVIDSKQGSYAALRWRSQSSLVVNLPAVTSSHDDLIDLAHTLHYLVGPLIGASYYGGTNGGAEVRVDGETPMEAMAAQSNAMPSIDTLRRS